jgi:hypothetical protein
MRIVINDANILIDLFHLDLVEVFFRLQGLDYYRPTVENFLGPACLSNAHTKNQTVLEAKKTHD